MKDFYKYRFAAIVSLIVSICFFISFLISNNNERNRFMSFNNSTIPNNELKQIESPTQLTLSFNKFYHLDSIQVRDKYGRQVLNIPTIHYDYEDKNDYSNVSADNYEFWSPYHWPLDEKQYSIINAMEVLADCNFSYYQKLNAPTKVTISDYLNYGLPRIFIEKVYKPLLRDIFNQTLYIRTSSPKSVLRAIRLNQVGKITTIYLYNGKSLNLDDELNSSLNSYENLFHSFINEKSKISLTKQYEYRLGLRSFLDHSEKAIMLAEKHIEEIKASLLTEKIELLATSNNSAIGQRMWTEIFYETAYPSWIDWLLSFGYITLCLFVVFVIIANRKRKLYNNLQNKLSQVQINYPCASKKYKLPCVLNTSDTEIELLLNRDFSVWEKEEHDLIEKQRQEQIIAQKVSELKRLYPNGWNIVKETYPNYSYADMVSVENNIIHEEKKFQQDEENARFEHIKKIAIEKETIKNDLLLLSQATQVGNIELAKEKIKALTNISESPTVNKELISIIETNKNEFNQKYSEGISDIFEMSYVDYTPPLNFTQADNWIYPVAKFPAKETFVFPYRRRKIARRGYMELSFQTYLTSNLGNCNLSILGDCAILPADNYRPYEPDIAIIDVERPSIRIDIEIDEPYFAIYNKPIHYIGCGDDFRDMNLNNLGWIVVRFTEYQVKNDMQGCASFIAQLIHSLNPSKSLPEFLLRQCFLQPQKQWTEIEAKIMASEKIREKYLNHEFGTIDSERIEITDIKQTEREKACAKLVKPLIVKSDYLRENKIKNNSVVFERDNQIQFLPQEHIYIYNGQEQFVPVSSVISCFFKPFDSFYWSGYKANQRHVAQGQILEEWDAKGTRSRDVGTFMHLQIENYYKGLPYQQEYSFKYNGKYIHLNEQINLEIEYGQFLEFLKNHEFKPFRTEWAIYDEKLKIAGTIDMIHKRGESFDIYDWKRSHRIVDIFGNPIATNSYGEKGLGKLNQIDDTPYWYYCVQQNLYRYILEKNYNIRVGKMYLVVFCDDTIEYRKLEVPHMDETIAAIIEACENGYVKKQLISLQGENLS